MRPARGEHLESAHVFHLGRIEPQFSNAFGSRTAAIRDDFPLLKGLSLYRLILAGGAFREPHWHPNANELSYCVRGALLVTIFGNGNERNAFTIGEGEMFFVPSGYLHAIENVGADEAEIVIAFSHEAPEDFGISGSVGCMSLEVMGNTWGLEAAALSGLTRSLDDVVIAGTAGAAEVGEPERGPNPYKFSVEAQSPPGIDTPYGGAQTRPAARSGPC